MNWQINFYNDSVYSDLMDWPRKIKAHLIKSIALMEEHGADLGMPHTKALGKGLFELRAKGQEGVGRAFFCYGADKYITILHGFIKKTQKAPTKELRLAQKRLKEVKNYEL